jgi:lysophospholipase L1-like esterase
MRLGAWFAAAPNSTVGRSADLHAITSEQLAEDNRRVSLPARMIAWALLGTVVICAITGCGGPSNSAATTQTTTTAASSTTSSKTWSIVALGDSVPSGYNCNCTPFPQLSAQGLTSSTGQTVTATNDAVSGYTTANVLNQLQSDTKVMSDVSKADAVEINIGANDIPYNKNSCGTTVDCYTPFVSAMQKNLGAVVSRVHDLTSGHKVLVELLDYWSIWLGGTYARKKGHDYITTARQVTAQVDSAIKSTASQNGSAYVSVRRAFKGPSFGYIEDHYLTSDGDHPNATGHQAIASAAEAVIKDKLGI